MIRSNDLFGMGCNTLEINAWFMFEPLAHNSRGDFDMELKRIDPVREPESLILVTV